MPLLVYRLTADNAGIFAPVILPLVAGLSDAVADSAYQSQGSSMMSSLVTYLECVNDRLDSGLEQGQDFVRVFLYFDYNFLFKLYKDSLLSAGVCKLIFVLQVLLQPLGDVITLLKV